MSAAESTLPADLLERAPEESARLLALAWLDDAAAARPRLDDPADEEALHDFRVAVRRLRSTLRTFKPVLRDAVPRKLRRRLGELADATNPARDAEVQLAWLERAVKQLTPAGRRGAAWLRQRVSAREAAARTASRAAVAADFAGLDRALRKRLQVLRLDVDLSRAERPTFASFVGNRLRELADELESDLGAVSSLADAEPAHRARLAAKRLRYLLEPFRREIDGFTAAAGELVGRLKSLQDELGDLHDAQVFAAALADLAANAAGERVRQRIELAQAFGSAAPAVRAARLAAAPPSLLPLVDRLRSEQQARFAALEREWLAGESASFLDAVRRFASALAGHALTAGSEGASVPESP